MRTLVRGKYVIADPTARDEGLLEDGAVCISEGSIEDLGPFDALRRKHPDAEVIGNGRQLLIPGLIDGHTHGEGLSGIQRGVAYDFLENSLIDWADMVDIDPELNAVLSGLRHLRNGCTTLHHNTWGESPHLLDTAEKALRGYRQVGIRVALSPGVRNENVLALEDEAFLRTLPSDLQAALRPSVELDKSRIVEDYFTLFHQLYDEHNDNDVKILFGPSWAHGSTDDFLVRVKQEADALGKVPIHIHTLQTPIQKAYALRRYGKSQVSHLDELGLVDSNLVLGHAVFVTEDDIRLLASKGASVTHHPSCNLIVRNGIAPVYYMHEAGVNVALGIDDKGINDDEDPIMELRMIHRLHRVARFNLSATPALDAFDVLAMGTVNASRVCGFGDELGALTLRRKADMVLLDLEEILEDPWMSPDLNIAEAFIHRAKGSHVNTVIVGGRVVVKDHRVTTVDTEELYREVRKQAGEGISAAQRQYAETLERMKPYYHAWYESWGLLDFDPFYVMNSRK
jgi:5-methylthioadenosine/S-adenosylhomocysteine deaminase